MAASTYKHTAPTIAELTAKLLAKPLAYAERSVEVEPYDVGASFVVEPHAAWAEATFALKHHQLRATSMIAEWPQIVGAVQGATLIPLAIGQFPQQVSQLDGMSSYDGSSLKTVNISRPLASEIAKLKQTATVPSLLTAAALERLAGAFTDAAQTLADAKLIGGDTVALQNETAALAWAKGDTQAATKIWDAMPASAIRSFNRGIAAMANGENLRAAECLELAQSELPETSGWHHLAGFYLSYC